MIIFDPLGFVCPYTLLGKINMKEAWSQKLGWDDQLPTKLCAKWVRLFGALFEFEHPVWTAAYDQQIRSDNHRLRVVPIIPQV